MNKTREFFVKKKRRKDLRKLYKEEKRVEKEYKKENKDYTSEILAQKGKVDYHKMINEKYIDVDTKKSKNNEEFDLNEQTLILSMSGKQIRNIKKQNNKKRKSDSYKDMTNSGNNMIEVKNITKYYLSNKKEATVVLKELNLNIEKGDFVVLFGKSGSGKSTLLNIISGLDRTTEGQVIVHNKNLPYLSNHELTKFRRENIAFIFQQYHLLNNITGYENVETGAILQKDKNHKLDIKQMFINFDLEDVMYKYPSQMSGGQQQRISILRAIAKNADIIFADEPTGALDKKTSDTVMELLKKINDEQGKTIIMVSHDPDVVKYAKRKIFLHKGKIISDERLR